ncbi:MAG: zinc-binding dehydrogenase, partial [Clostridia bacterium]
VAVHAVRQAGEMRGLKVAVIGAGPIGNLVAQAAKSLGAQSVLVTDVSDYRLTLAKRCGADAVYNARQTNLGEAMLNAFGPD